MRDFNTEHDDEVHEEQKQWLKKVEKDAEKALAYAKKRRKQHEQEKCVNYEVEDEKI